MGKGRKLDNKLAVRCRMRMGDFLYLSREWGSMHHAEEINETHYVREGWARLRRLYLKFEVRANAAEKSKRSSSE